MPDRIEVQGAGKPGVDYIEVPTAQENMINALLAEREGYAQSRAAGETLRHGVDVEAILGKIDEQLRALGADVPEDVTPYVATESSAPQPTPRGRRGVTPA